MNGQVSYALILLTLVFGIAFDSSVGGQETSSPTDNEIVDKEFGFKISRPDDGWSFRTTKPKPGWLMVKVSQKDAGGKVEATIIAEPVSTSDDQATQRRDAAFERTEGKNEFSNRSKKTFKVGGIEASGFEIDWMVQEEQYRVHQCYIVNQDLMYTVAIHSPVDQFDSLAGTLSNIRDSLKFVRISNKTKRKSALRRLVARCGSEVNWANSWDEASEQAKRENKSVLVHVRSQPGFDISDGMTTVALMDQDIIEFVNEHCVVFRYEKGMPAPINKYEKYGIGPNSFGNTVLLVDPDGTVFGDTFTSEPHTFYDFLLTSFADRSVTGEPPNHLETPIHIADWLARRGDLASALNRLEGLESAKAHQKRASIFRRRRNVDEALSELKLALEKTNEANLRAELLIEQTSLRLSAGRIPPKEALTVFEGLLKESPIHERSAEVMFLIGLCQYAESNKSGAEKTWMELIDSFDEDNRWTWQAAAALTSTAFRMDIVPEFGWPKEDVVVSFRRIPFEQLDVAQIHVAEKEAIAYLISKQRDDGSWISPPNALKAKAYNTNPFTIAITSICAKSLLPHRGEPEIAKRIERAIEFLTKSNDDAQTKEDKPFYMDYSPWADAYLLRFLSAYVQNEPDQKQRIEPLVRDAIKALSNKQKPGGGWSYYITHQLGQTSQPSNQSISFMTAAVTIALLETREADFEVSEELTKSALDCLDHMRCEDKTFSYFLWHERETEGKSGGVEGAAGRGPVCSLALAMAGQGSTEEVSACLDLFLKHKDLYSRERGKSLMHAAPGGQGSHYLMFDYAWAAEAAASLPPEQKKLYRDRLLELILSSRSKQGCYLDNPINGWHYGTGMALEAMHLLQ